VATIGVQRPKVSEANRNTEEDMKKAVRTAKGTAQIIWLGVASLAGVGLLVWLGSMLLPGDDAGTGEVVASGEPDLTESAEAPASVVDNGSWIILDDRDPIDDGREVIVMLEGDDARLMVGCTDADTRVFIAWDDYLGLDSPITVTHRLPPQPAQRAGWFNANGRATAAPNPKALLQEIIGEPELIVRTTPYMSGPVTVTFDLTGAAEAIGKVAEACDWQLEVD
jgi:hypothetical protein